MKKVKILVLGLLAMATICPAQNLTVTNLGVIPASAYPSLAIANYVPSEGTGRANAAFANNVTPMGLPASGPIAEAITPEIQALTDGLQDNPLQIYNYVHDHIRHVLYFGSKKGAELTLLEKSGNDFDQCALLVAMLRAAGYSNAGYQFGWMMLPLDNANHNDLRHWLGLTVTNSTGSWPTTSAYLYLLIHNERGYPIAESNFDTNTFAFQRVWVTVTVGGTNYNLDPSFKVSEPIAGVNLPTAMGFNSTNLLNAAGGLDFGNYTTNFYATNLSEANIRGTLTGYTTNLINYLQANCPNASVQQVLSGTYIVPNTNGLTQSPLFPVTNMFGTMPVISWVNEPTNMMSTLTVSYLSTNCEWLMPQLQGQRLSLTVSSGGSAQLWLSDSNVATANTGGGAFNVTMTAYHPGLGGSWDTTNNMLIPTTYTTTLARPYQGANASYAMLYCFEPDWGWLQERENQLDAYIQQGYSTTSRQVVTETLNIMGMNWMLQSDVISQTVGAQVGALPFFYHRIGRMGQESGKGYYVDVYMQTYASSSSSTTTDDHVMRWIDNWSYFASAMEHGIIEQLQSTTLVGASTIKMLELANTNHYAVYLVNATNWPTVQKYLVNYTLNDLAGYISAGYNLLLPQNGTLPVNGSGSWTGYGFEARQVNAVGINTSMLIGSGQFGGYSSDLNATINPTFVDYYDYSQPSYFSSAPVSVPSATGADPVNMADGTFQVQGTDLSLGQTEPRGMSFSHYYSSLRRNSNLAGMAPGWVHNYYLNAATVSSPQAGLGATTPAQMAPMLAAVTAAAGVYNGAQPDPKNWLTTAIISKWAIDQLTAKAVSVTMGESTVQFIQQPDGSFTPPANCTMTLAKNGTGYNLQERHGRTFQFNGSGWCTNIVDQYNQNLSLTYNSSNWVRTVTDWKKNRTLTFNYSTTTPIRLISVADNAGRSISLGYSSSNDLVSIKDPESKTNSFRYDPNHQIIATFNANGQLVASNLYNAFGRVTTQYTVGDTNKTWRIFWSGWQTVSQDPAGGQTSYFYDDNTRLIAQQDALRHLSQKFYDGQDHVVATVSPLNEINQFIYDGNNNLIQTVDPLNNTNQFVYDGQNNLIQALDARGNSTTYGYNSQFSLTGQTNGAGDWVNVTYNTDGTLQTRTDFGGQTKYDTYDSYGQLTHITYPGTFGGETFVNNSFGDPTSHTDARGFPTTYQYNLRRQMTNSIAPTNLTVHVSFDPVGNAATTTDARGNVTSNSWSATQHLLSTTLPPLLQGVPVITNAYDNRDLLVKTVDPLTHSVLCTNDLIGHTISVTDPLLRTARMTFDADGRTLTAANAGNETNSQAWDLRGNLVQSTDGAGHSSQRVFDGANNLTVLTNRNSNPWHFYYDGANRLTNVVSPLGNSTTVTLNHQGLPTTIIDPLKQSTSLYYDAKGRLTNRTDFVTTLYSFDANDNVTNVSENGLTNVWTYDAYNRVSSYQDVYGNVIQYRYDANANVTNVVYPGSKNVYYAFDTQNHLTNVTDWSGRKTSIAYDLAGHMTALTRPNGSYRSMGYDSAGQLTNIWEQMSNSLPIAWFRFNWTNSGNMAWEFAAPLPHAAIVPTRMMTYDADNRLNKVDNNTVTVNADGNLTAGPLTNDTFANYTFDARNRLSNVGGVTNAYDMSGNRVGLAYGTNSSVFVINPNAALPQVLMRIKNGVTNYYVYGAGLLYQITEAATGTNTITYHYDYRGNTVALSADNGAVTDRIEYSAYGLTTYRAGTTDTPFLFNGRFGVMTDPNGLLDMRARYYNPFLCRFISADPSGFNGGLNLYAYANGNPVGFVDPFGLGALSDALAATSWFNAPTPEDLQLQAALSTFVNIATLGVANLATETFSGSDMWGNHVSPEDQNTAAILFMVTLIPGVDVEGVGDSIAVEAAESVADRGSGGGIVYGELDSLGRPTGAYGNITQDTLGTGSSASQSIIPPGFQGGAAGQARGHLWGNQLGGSGADARNLVTIQQNPANSPVMRGFENQIRAAVQGGQSYIGSVTTIYNGNNLVPRGITMRGFGSGGFRLGVTVLNPPGF